MVTLEQAAEYLRAAQDVLVLSHQYPDGDTLGSAFALVRTLQRMGKRARFACSHAIGKPYRFLEETVEKQSFEPKCVVTGDVAAPSLLYGHRSLVAQVVDDLGQRPASGHKTGHTR